ncbi:MAG: MFS transporter [Candidatus Nanopelagicales bacterium]
MTHPLKAALGSPLYRKLLAIRLTGQAGDGMLQSALATFVLFSPERQASASAIAAAFAILALPYSLIGPFTGVFLDRWHRQRVLLWGNLIRAVSMVPVIYFTAQGNSGFGLGVSVLIAIGINRFVLAGLSAAVPLTVPEPSLYTANAVAPTAGTMAAALAAFLGVGLRQALGGGDAGSVVVLCITAGVFIAAGLLATRVHRREFGPLPGEHAQSARQVVRGLVDGADQLLHRHPARNAIVMVSAQRIAIGAGTIIAVLLLRLHINPPDAADQALNELALMLGAAAAGAFVGAVITPAMSRRLGPIRWTSMTYLAAGAVGWFGVAAASVASLILAGLLIGFAGQAAKVCGDTLVQEWIDEGNRGRVFALYDVAVNVALVSGVVFVAVLDPSADNAGLTAAAIGLGLIASALLYLRTRIPGTVPGR